MHYAGICCCAAAWGARRAAHRSDVARTALVALAASVTAAAVGLGIDRGFGLDLLTQRGGGLGSILRLAILGIVMLAVTFALMVAVKLPEALSVVAMLQRRLGGRLGARLRAETQDHASVMGNSPGHPCRTLIRVIQSAVAMPSARQPQTNQRTGAVLIRERAGL